MNREWLRQQSLQKYVQTRKHPSIFTNNRRISKALQRRSSRKVCILLLYFTTLLTIVLSQTLSESGPRMVKGTESPQLNKSEPEFEKMHLNKEEMETDEAELTEIAWTKSISINECSQELSEILEILLRGKPDDALKASYEESLERVTNAIPEPSKAFTQCYPQNYLSEILITNYGDLVKFCLLYLNLTLSLKVTKFVVNLFYSLECWEIYHLLQMIPNLDYFLRLVDIEVTDTPFGYVVSPPENYMGFNLRQGFQYPFPFPFYNFSYHTMNPDSKNQKYQRLRIDNYIDIRLNKTQPKKKKRTKAPKKSSLSQEVSLPRQDSSVSEASQELTFQRQTSSDIELDYKAFGDLEDEDDGYTTEEAAMVLKEENKIVPPGLRGIVFVPSIHQQQVLPSSVVSAPGSRLNSSHEFMEASVSGGVYRQEAHPMGSHGHAQAPHKSPESKRGTSLVQPPSFIAQAPIPTSLQYPLQYKDASSLPYYGTHPLPQFPAYASALIPPTTLVSPPPNQRSEEGHQEHSPQMQQYGYPGYPAFPPYGQPFYGDRRLFVQMPLQGYVPMGVPPQKLQGQGMPQNIHSPQFQHQYMPVPHLGYQYPVAEVSRAHGSPPMAGMQSNPSPPLPNPTRLPHIREDEKPKK